MRSKEKTVKGKDEWMMGGEMVETREKVLTSSILSLMKGKILRLLLLLG